MAADEVIGSGAGASDIARLVRSVRRLTVAVWILVILFGLLLVGGFLVVSSWFMPGVTTASYAPAPPISEPPEIRNFHELPLNDQINAASVIVLARHEREGDRIKCIVSEVLKQSPGTVFYYKVGDEYAHCGHQVKANTFYGDGQLIFFLGNPASMRFSTTFTNGRIGGLGDLPLDALRRQIATPAN